MAPHPVGAVRPRMPDIRHAARAAVPIVHDVADAAARPAPTKPVEAAVLAPTAGPVVGGWITETATWHWLFLINVLPGIVSAIGGYWLLSSQDRRRGRLSELDVPALVLLAVALCNLELGLKAAPESGWT